MNVHQYFVTSAELRCVPTIEADCDFTVEKAREILKGTSPKVYLGFDDGPGHGSKDVVAALNKNNVQVRKRFAHHHMH